MNMDDISSYLLGLAALVGMGIMASVSTEAMILVIFPVSILTGIAYYDNKK